EQGQKPTLEIGARDDIAAVAEYGVHRRDAVAAVRAKRAEPTIEVFAHDEIVPLRVVGCVLDACELGDGAEVDERAGDRRTRNSVDNRAIGFSQRARGVDA